MWHSGKKPISAAHFFQIFIIHLRHGHASDWFGFSGSISVTDVCGRGDGSGILQKIREHWSAAGENLLERMQLLPAFARSVTYLLQYRGRCHGGCDPVLSDLPEEPVPLGACR